VLKSGGIMKILVIGPHPDDLEFGCGGTLYKLSEKGFKLNLLVITKGEYGANPHIREEEQMRSAKILKANLSFAGFKDTEVPMGRELISFIEKSILNIKPDLIFVNYFNDTHQDHRNVSKATITAARYVNNLIFYEVPTTLDFLPNIFSDIGDVLNVKTRLLKCHYSQIHKTKVKNLSIIESAKSTAIFRGYQARVKYAEGFMAQRILLDPFLH